MSETFNSAAAAAAFLADSPELEKEIEDDLGKSRLTRMFTQFRLQQGFTQKEIAQRMSVHPSRVSKFESGTDENLRLSEIVAYLKAMDMSMSLSFDSDTIPRAQRIKHLVSLIDDSLKELVETAKELKDDKVICDEISRFYKEVLFSFLKRYEDNYNQLSVVLKLDNPSPVASSIVNQEGVDQLTAIS